MSDAKALGLASYDRSSREWFLAVPVAMEQRGNAAPPANISRDRRGAPWAPDEIAQLRALAGRGECALIIGRRMGRTPAAVSQKARRAGVALN